MPNYIIDIPKAIKEIRKTKGYSQKKLAEIIGVSQSSIFQWENGTRNPKIEQIEKLSEIIESEPAFFEDLIEDLTEAPQNWSIQLKNFTESDLDTVGESNLILAYRCLNCEGKQEAIKRVSELTEIKKYIEPENK